MTSRSSKQIVLLMRHCVRSTKTTIKICDGNGNNNSRDVNITDYINVPLPDYGVPPMWCTPKGLDYIEKEGQFIINQVVLPESPSHLHVNFVVDESHRDVDTAIALSKGMKEALELGQLVTFSGLDEIELATDLFKPEGGSNDTYVDPEALCPRTEYTLQDLSHQIEKQINDLEATSLLDEQLEGVLELLVTLGAAGPNLLALDRDQYKCPGTGQVGLLWELLIQLPHAALYSKASNVKPFLPTATDQEIYRMLYLADCIRSLKGVGNILSAKKGIIMAKSMLAALRQHETNRLIKKGNMKETLTLTVFVGHDGDLDNIATALGLRWTMPAPYFHTEDQVGRVVATPPGSGILLSSTAADVEDVSMSFLCPVNLIGNESTDHQLTPIFTTDGMEDKMTMDELESRLAKTLDQYPSLLSCYEKSPTFPKVSGTPREVYAEDVASWPVITLIASNAIFLLLCLLCQCYQRRKSYGGKYAEVELQTRAKGAELT